MFKWLRMFGGICRKEKEEPVKAMPPEILQLLLEKSDGLPGVIQILSVAYQMLGTDQDFRNLCAWLPNDAEKIWDDCKSRTQKAHDAGKDYGFETYIIEKVDELNAS